MKEEELIYNYRLGNEEALSFLFSIYEKKVVNFYEKNKKIFELMGYDREDRLSFVRRCVFVAVTSYQFGDKSFNTYYSAVANREIINSYRQIKVTSAERFIDPSVSLSDSLTLEKMVVEEEKYDDIDLSMIMEKVKQIGEIDYNILKLYLEGNTYIEIGEKLNLKPKSVSNYLQKIRTKLKKIDVYD